MSDVHADCDDVGDNPPSVCPPEEEEGGFPYGNRTGMRSAYESRRRDADPAGILEKTGKRSLHMDVNYLRLKSRVSEPLIIV